MAHAVFSPAVFQSLCVDVFYKRTVNFLHSCASGFDIVLSEHIAQVHYICAICGKKTKITFKQLAVVISAQEMVGRA